MPGIDQEALMAIQPELAGVWGISLLAQVSFRDTPGLMKPQLLYFS